MRSGNKAYAYATDYGDVVDVTENDNFEEKIINSEDIIEYQINVVNY